MIEKILALTAITLFSFASETTCGSHEISTNHPLRLSQMSSDSDMRSKPCPYSEVLEFYANPDCPKDGEYHMKMAIFSNCLQVKEAFCRY